MGETYTARCFYCNWGETSETAVIKEHAQAHVHECPGPILAVARPWKSRVHNTLRFWSDRTRCAGCEMPTALCMCVPVD